MSGITIPHRRLSGFYFFYFALIGAYLPYWNIYLENLGFSKYAIGMLTAIGLTSRIIGPSVWGIIADRYGQRMRLVQLSSLIQMIVWVLILISPKQLAPIALILFLSNFFQSAILAQYEAVTLAWLDGDRRGYGRIRLWGSIGFATAVLGIGFWFDYVYVVDLPIILIALASLCFISASLIRDAHDVPSHGPAVGFWQQLNQPVLLFFFALEAIMLLSQAPFYTFYSNYLKAYGYHAFHIGVLWTIGIAVEVILFTRLATFLRWPSQHLLLLCFMVTALRWVLVAHYADIFWIQLLAQLGHAFSFALFHGVAMHILDNHVDRRYQGSAQGVYNTIWGVGIALGSFMAGKLWTDIGGEGVFYLSASLCLFASFIIIFAVFFTKRLNSRMNES